ncbi:ABC transporter permease, partial [Rhodovulum imhoffii]
MTPRIAFRIARRELRGGLRGFYIFLACLALGVAAIAAVGSVRDSIQTGLKREGAVLLGGDAEVTLTYRFATLSERAWMEATGEVSEVVDFRSMITVGQDRALTQIKAVDGAYPLYGRVGLDPAMALEDALSGNGAVMERVLADRLGLRPGDAFRLGTASYTLSAILTREPDAAGGGFGLGPRLILRTEALEGSGLLQPGTLFETKYRLAIPDADLPALQAEAETGLAGGGLRWRDARNGAPGMTVFVDRLAAFLVLVGLAGLAVGGVGVSAAVRAYLERKTQVIATLKTLGAESGTILLAYLIQIGVLAGLGIVLGLALGAVLPLTLGPAITARLPVPVEMALHPAPLMEAAAYGVLTALLFTLWPLARTERIRAAALFREVSGKAGGWPRPAYVIATGGLAVGLVGLAALFTGAPRLAIWAAAGIAGALGLLALAALALHRGARWLARWHGLRGHPVLRLALGAVGGPGGEVTSVVLSLGLGLSVLAAVGQIDANLRSAIAQDIPKRAPSYFVVDIQPDQLRGFKARVQNAPGVTRLQTAPMLRGIITRINGQPARAVAGDHWVLRGDRGVTYSARKPPDVRVTEGVWWSETHDGPPVMSFAAEEARELGLKLGDTVDVNILGRDITATVTSFREVDFSTAGIGFVMSMNPGALQGAPHTHIATIYAQPQAEAALLRDLANAYPNITAIRVRDALDRVGEVLGGLAAAISLGAGITLAAGAMVLIGAAAAGERARLYEAAVLKTVGAVRPQVLASFALRSALMGAAAGGVAL